VFILIICRGPVRIILENQLLFQEGVALQGIEQSQQMCDLFEHLRSEAGRFRLGGKFDGIAKNAIPSGSRFATL